MQTTTTFLPVDIQVQNEKSLIAIKWKDGKTSNLPITRVRAYCPCAECQGHHAGVLRKIENRVSGIFAAEPVGRYGINFKFSDGHATGIFRWEQLRKLDPDEEKQWGDPVYSARERL